MHRPGIARVSGSAVILNGTTIDEVKKYHRDTLLLAVAETNKQYREVCKVEEQKLAQDKQWREEHRRHVKEASAEIKFD